MSGPVCLNCETAISPPMRFCARCGQRTDTWRLTFIDIVRDLMHTFVNVERGPLAFAWALLTRPGSVAREYVEGKRRRHFGPFATLAVIAGVTAVVTDLSRFAPLSNDGLAPGPTELLQRHLNVLVLLQLPFVGGACSVVFRSARLTLPEHCVLAAYTLSVQSLVLTLLSAFAFFDSTVVPGTAYVYTFWITWYLYFGWAASQFHGSERRPWVRGSLSAAIGHAALIAVLFGASAGYEARGTRLFSARTNAAASTAGDRGGESGDRPGARTARLVKAVA